MFRETADMMVIEAIGSNVHFSVDFDFVIQRRSPHPLNIDNHHHVAFTRGPFVYCAETIDNPDISDLRAVRISKDALVRAVVDGKTFVEWGLEDVVVLKILAVVLDGTGEKRVEVTLIPLFLWANRGNSDHRVWLPLL
jgi:DUF1680 family protein